MSIGRRNDKLHTLGTLALDALSVFTINSNYITKHECLFANQGGATIESNLSLSLSLYIYIHLTHYLSFVSKDAESSQKHDDHLVMTFAIEWHWGNVHKQHAFTFPAQRKH
jgi:hypothetical protein